MRTAVGPGCASAEHAATRETQIGPGLNQGRGVPGTRMIGGGRPAILPAAEVTGTSKRQPEYRVLYCQAQRWVNVDVLASAASWSSTTAAPVQTRASSSSLLRFSIESACSASRTHSLA
jgi:hypothetical protein